MFVSKFLNASSSEYEYLRRYLHTVCCATLQKFSSLTLKSTRFFVSIIDSKYSREQFRIIATIYSSFFSPSLHLYRKDIPRRPKKLSQPLINEHH